MWIEILIDTLERHGVQYAIVGGYALALHGVVRGTVNVDLVLKISRDNYRNGEKALAEIGLTSRLPVGADEVIDFREEYIRNKNMVAWNFRNLKDLTQDVNIIITHDLSAMKVDKFKAGQRMLPVVSVRDLIKMKRKSGRPQDIQDIEALERLNI